MSPLKVDHFGLTKISDQRISAARVQQSDWRHSERDMVTAVYAPTECDCG
jgi:hypothetical protein